MIEKLKKKKKRYGIGIAIFLWILAVVFGVIEYDSVKGFFTEPVSFNDLKAEDLREGLRVKGTVYYFLDYYTHREHEGATTAMEIFIPVGEDQYIGFLCSGDTMKAAMANMQIYWDYLDGQEMDSDSLQEVEVDGIIMPLEGKSLKYYTQYVDSLEVEAEYEQLFLPYVLKQEYYGALNKPQLCIMTAFIVLFIIGGVGFLRTSSSTSNLKQLMQYCEKQPNPQAALSEIERFYEMNTPVGGIRADDRYFMALSGVKVYFVETSKLLWVYRHVVQHYTSFIPSGKTYFLMLKMADEKELSVPMKNKKETEAALQYLSARLPYLFFGYTDETNAMYHDDHSQMVTFVAEQRKQMTGERTSS